MAAVAKRGLVADEVTCGTFMVGWFGGKDRRRVVNLTCYSFSRTVNIYMRPIDGLTVTVDFDEMKIVGFRDRLVVQVPKTDMTDYRDILSRYRLLGRV